MSVSAADAENRRSSPGYSEVDLSPVSFSNCRCSEKFGHKTALRFAGILWQKTDDGDG
jgi:hypothetical protein